LASGPVAWTVLEARGAVSRGGAKLNRQPDQSLLASGPNPATETYVIDAASGLSRITGLRLEALPHDGPAGKVLGRSVHGNVVRTNITLKVNGTPVKWKDAVADFSQTGFPIRNAIDGDLSSGWGIHPNVERANTATLVCEPTKVGGEGTVAVEIE